MLCGLLSVPLGVQWLVYVLALRHTSEPFSLDDFLCSEYPSSMQPTWYWTNVVCLALVLLFACSALAFRRPKEQRLEQMSPFPPLTRLFTSYGLAALATGVGVAGCYGVVVGEFALYLSWRKHSAQLSRATLALVVSFLSSVYLFVYGVVAVPLSRALTKWEDWGASHSRAAVSLASKLALTRIVALVTMLVFSGRPASSRAQPADGFF